MILEAGEGNLASVHYLVLTDGLDEAEGWLARLHDFTDANRLLSEGQSLLRTGY